MTTDPSAIPYSHELVSLREFYKSRPDLEDRAQKALEVLNKSRQPADHIAGVNIGHEATMAFYEDLCERLQMDKPELDEVREIIREVARRHSLEGPEALWTKEQVYGRAVEWDAFVELLKSKVSLTTDQAEAMIVDLLTQSDDSARLQLKDVELGNYLMWATLDREDHEHPFQSIKKDPDSIRCSLGLPKDGNGPLLLLRFHLDRDENEIPRCPTVADAYGADDWPYYFTLNPIEADVGRTVCWDGGTNSRPEVVHPVICGKRLCTKPQRVG